MRGSRNAVIKAPAAPSFALPTYTGSHAIFGDEKQGYIECYTTGTITFPKAGVVDVFVLGSGLKGGTGYTNESIVESGAGGGGAVGTTKKGVEVTTGYSTTISIAGECSSTSSANKSTAFGVSANKTTANGGTSGYVNYQTVYRNAGTGSNGTSYPFGEKSGTFYKKLGAGGGGGRASVSWNGQYTANPAKGGTLGGGHGYASLGAVVGTANTGSGGGGTSVSNHYSNEGAGYQTVNGGGNGGSGIVIIRWGYAA